MKKSVLLAGAGTVAILAGSFLPLMNLGDLGAYADMIPNTLFKASAAKAIICIVLAAGCTYMASAGRAKNNSFPIISLVLGVLTFGILGIDIFRALGAAGMAIFGIGLWILLIGSILTLLGGIIALKEK